ncbi:MAG: hypothetical protein JKY56_06430, partial [Kofleriaceae bacterium]|nr:hypothetical protein [Kofleriaceae bacterium]
MRAVLAVGTLLLLFSGVAEASHFRHGNIDWRVPNPSLDPLTVEFTVRSSWRSTLVGNPRIHFGDGASAFPPATVIGSGVDASGNAYTTTEYVTTHTYASAGEYTARFNSCCRVAGLQGGTASRDFRVEAIVSLRPDGSNTGPPNMGVLPIQQLEVSGIRQLSFPIADPDGDAVTCRFATDAEAGLPTGTTLPTVPGTTSQPSIIQDGSGGNFCVVEWDTANGVIGHLFVMQIVLESTNGGVVSKTANDFLIEFVLPPPPICVGSGVYQLTTGSPFSVTVTTTGASALTLAATGMPAGATVSPSVGSSQASPASATFSWTPGAGDDSTSRSVLLSFTDTDNLTGACFLNLVVGGCGNGVIEFGEDCDGDGGGGGGETSTCNSNCTVSSCGDSVRNASSGEGCDDGNLVSGDGCASSCLIEDGGPCANNTECVGVCDLLGSNTCEPANRCGNGALDSGEVCDDGNLVAGDGCSAGCLIEDGGACTDNVQCVGVCDLLGSDTCEPVNGCGNGTLDVG